MLPPNAETTLTLNADGTYFVDTVIQWKVEQTGKVKRNFPSAWLQHPDAWASFKCWAYLLQGEGCLAIEFIALNCSINQKTHNNMSINVFPLSHQVGTIWRHTCSSHICFSAKGASLQSCSPSCFYRAIQIGRLQWYILLRWWLSLCPTPSIGRFITTFMLYGYLANRTD